MILLDTNIISELMKVIPDKNVVHWINHQEVTQLFVSTITLGEISYGLNALPAGKRRSSLEQAFNKAILEAFADRILSFNEAAAYQYGKIMGQRKKKGKPMSVPDGQIAAIAASNQTILVTRDVKDFVDCGLELVNPFKVKPH